MPDNATHNTTHAHEKEHILKKLNECLSGHARDKHLTVDLLARLMHMSRPTLYRKMKNITDLTPNELIKEVRLKKAAELLAAGEYRSFEVARMVGYTSQSSFGKSFRKQFKLTPATYQRMKNHGCDMIKNCPQKMIACLLAILTVISLNPLTASGQNQKRTAKAANKPAIHSGVYRNLFREAGYDQAAIDQKIAKAWYDIFEGPGRVYFEVGDSMAYVSDVKNHDARTEGLSYGMMIAVQLNRKEVFDRIWRWSKKYLQHQSGPREGYFAWSINPQTMKKNSEGSASDGELYYITSLLFAANRWGNNTGIHYYKEARRILDAMWKKDGTGNIYNLVNTEHKQITFVPEGGNYNWTDPSYHLPAFYEIWVLYAKDGHEQFYKDCADTSRVFLHRACDPVTGLNTDYTEFSGKPHPTRWMPPAFRYDSWRVPMNIAMDYVWFRKDKDWQEDYARRFQNFLRSKGIDSYEDQFNVDGTRPDFILQAGSVKKLRHSIGLVSTAATASLINKEKNSMDFVHAIWNAKLEPYEDGYFDPYYDGLLYLFSLLHLSGKYQVITP